VNHGFLPEAAIPRQIGCNGRSRPLFGQSQAGWRCPLADIEPTQYGRSMERPRHTWLYSRKAAEKQTADAGVEGPGFRSDSDLHQWWMWLRFAVPMTGLCYGVLTSFGVPFNYTPLATLPAIIFYGVIRFIAWRDRKAGKRFNQYDADDLFW